jgi:hypothetical protein
VGEYGFLMTTAFFSMSVGSLSFVYVFYKITPQQAKSRIGLILFGVWGIGVLVAMLFPINPAGTELTTTSTIHRINGPIVFLSLTMGAILISSRFRRHENWRPFYPASLTLSLIMLALFITTGASIATNSGFEGICQRVFLMVFVTWFTLTTLRLRSTIRNGDRV